MEREVFNKIFAEIIKDTSEKSISFEPSLEKCSIYNSKLGGTPYLQEEADDKLRFLGQINFGELPILKGFPEKGMLQFFISADENKMWGANDYGEYKIIYHENINYNLKQVDKEKGYAENFPIKREYRLKGSIKFIPMTVNDYRFNEEFMSIFKKYCNSNAEGYWEVEGIDEDEINEIFAECTIRCGGNPSFIQDDIRQYNCKYKDSVLLFAIPSITAQGINISWGDSGVANFFISKKDLMNKDFNNVLFSWDCY